MKIPKELGAAVDMLFRTKEKRLALARKVEELEKEENELKEHLIRTLPKSKAGGVAGRVGRVTIVEKEIPQAKDWDKFYAFVRKTDAFELLQRRLNTKAIGERLDEGERIPGVEIFKTPVVSMSKR